MATKDIFIKLAIKDQDLLKQIKDVLSSFSEFVVLGADDTIWADLLFFELGEELDKEFEYIHSLIKSDELGEIFLVSGNCGQDVLLRAMKTGVREFFCLPINEEEIIQALNEFKERRKKTIKEETVKTGHIINVIGSKGGVGTTTVAVNLSASLAEKENVESVALIDMNLLFGEIPHFLDIEPSYNWSEITKNISRLDSTFLFNILTKHSTGIYVLPSPSYLSSQNVATPEIMERLLNVMRRMFDFVIIDGGQSMNDISLKILELSDTVFVVSILSIPCLSNTNKLLKTFYDLGFPQRERIKVIINRYLKNSDISLEDAKLAIKHKIFWSIPNDYRTTVSAINKGKTLFQVANRAPIVENFRQLANTFAPEEVKNEKKWWKISIT